MKTRIEKTTGIVLNTAPVSETSMAVHWITEDYGWLSTLLKGAYRPKNHYQGQVDLFYECEVLFYPRMQTQLHLAKEISLLDPRPRFRSDYRACALASYFSNLVTRISIPDAPYRALYRLHKFALDFLQENGANLNVVHWVELKILELQGVAPQLSACCRCGKPAQLNGRPCRLSISAGGVVCSGCAVKGGTPGIQAGPDIIGLLLRWQRADKPRAALQTRCTQGQHMIINKLLGQFLEYHLDTSMVSRTLAFQASA